MPRVILAACALLGRCACLWLPQPGLPRAQDGPPSLSGRLRSLPQEERLRRSLPFAWVHVPKTGSPYMNAVLHLPGVCPGIPHDLLLCDSWNPNCSAFQFAFVVKGPVHFFHPPRLCSGLSRWCTHDGFSSQYLHGGRGHGVTILRQAEQRIMSGYYNQPDHHGWHWDWPEPASILEYADAVQGTAVKMLVGDGSHFAQGPPFPGDVEQAIHRLREGFAFVGIFEEYELSACLLHKMFGNSCRPQELGRFHISRTNTSARVYDTSPLQGFQDAYDGALYQEGLRIFKENLRLYGATPAGCRQCFLDSGLSSGQLGHVGKVAGF